MVTSWQWNPGLGGLVWVWDPSPPMYPSWFSSTTSGCGTTHSTSLCLCASPHISASLLLLLIYTNVVSLIPWLLDSHTTQFSDNSGWYLFCSLVVIFAVVVEGAEPCLPVSPYWLEEEHYPKSWIKTRIIYLVLNSEAHQARLGSDRHFRHPVKMEAWVNMLHLAQPRQNYN